MIAKIITNIILIIGLGITQIALVSGLPGLASNLNLVLVFLIFILGFSNFNLAASWAIGVGFLLEIFSFLPFGVYLFSLSLTIIIANFLLNYFFTNRSLYSFLALTVITTFVYKLIMHSFLLIFIEISSSALVAADNFWFSILEQISLNLIFTFIIYYIIYFLGRNLKPVFLIKGLPR
jgi:cell shape-determining protein MreD